MEKKVLITVNSHIEGHDGEGDSISFVTEGKLVVENGEYVVSYDETEVTGLAGTKTILRIGKDNVTLIRQGYVDSMLLFEVGKLIFQAMRPIRKYNAWCYCQNWISTLTSRAAISRWITSLNITAVWRRNKLNVVVSEIKSSNEQEMEQ